jgi:hypothetical protein
MFMSSASLVFVIAPRGKQRMRIKMVIPYFHFADSPLERAAGGWQAKIKEDSCLLWC